MNGIRFDGFRPQYRREALAIERLSYPFPWDAEDFSGTMRRKNVDGIVAKDQRHTVVGYLVYESHPESIGVLNLAVHPNLRRLGIGTRLVGKLLDRMGPTCSEAAVEVDEENVGAQLFWRAMGFKAVRILEDYWQSGDESRTAYHFVLADKPLRFFSGRPLRYV